MSPVPRPVIILLQLCLLTAAGCTTNSYYREDGVKITVKKFVGIPYLEKEERTKVVTPGSDKVVNPGSE